jgi:8-oxo-dGTP pyrophosphatase MutT (NUDIX family)
MYLMIGIIGARKREVHFKFNINHIFIGETHMEQFTSATQTVAFCIKRGTTGTIEEVLVARKKKKVGAGYLNGYGGNRESNENVLHCAVRELHEETNNGMTAKTKDLLPVGCFDIVCIPFKLQIRLWVFLLETFEGEPQETDEMEKGQWLHVDSLPYNEFMPADREFLPQIFAGKKLMGDFTLDVDTESGDPKRLKVIKSHFVKVSDLNMAELTEV